MLSSAAEVRAVARRHRPASLFTRYGWWCIENAYWTLPAAPSTASNTCSQHTIFTADSHLNHAMGMINGTSTFFPRSLTSLCERMQRLSRPEGAQLLSCQAFHNLSPTGKQQAQEQPPSEKDRQCSPAKNLGKSGSGTMAKSLVKTVMALSDVKEDVYGALDEWASFELEFPIVAVRKALERLRQQEQWHRIIQVTKWMLSKGLGKTHGTYSLMLKAYCMNARLEDAEALWDKILALHTRSMPKNMFAYMTNVYRRHEMPEKVIKVFEQMESFGIKPDVDLLRRVGEAYQELGMQEKQEELIKKYPLNSKTRRNEKRIAARKALKASKTENTTIQTDDDEDYIKENSITAPTAQTMASSRTDSFLEPVASCQRSNSGIEESEEEVCEGGRTLTRLTPSRRDEKPISVNAYQRTKLEINHENRARKATSPIRQNKFCRSVPGEAEDPRRRVKSEAAADGDEEFVKQIIATM